MLDREKALVAAIDFHARQGSYTSIDTVLETAERFTSFILTNSPTKKGAK